MSANHARRHRTGQAEVAYLGDRPSRRLATLLESRDCLAARAAEYAAHDIAGADELLRCVADAQALIKNESPATHEQRWAAWIRQDAKLAHKAEAGHPACGLCAPTRAQARAA
jgi:hypothetical protein